MTPLTHALAAALSSTGDPLALDPSKDKATIVANIANVKTYLTQALSSTLTTSGVDPATFDPINSKFSADHTKADKVIDNLQVNVATDGAVSLVHKGAASAMVDDMGQTAAQTSAQGQQTIATANNAITLKKGVTDFTKAPVKMDGNLVDASIADKARDNLNQCFAVASTLRGTVASPGAGCKPLAAMVDPNYMNDGNNASREFDQALADPKMDKAVFKAPTIIRFFSADRAMVKFGFKRADGVSNAFSTVVKNFGTIAAPNWKLSGNQRSYNVFMNAVAEKRDELNPGASLPSAYNSGLNLFVDANAGNGAGIRYVKVTGPGLPAAGVVLKPSLGNCKSLTIVDNNGNIATAQKNTCSSIFRLTGVAQSGTATYRPWGTSPLYAQTQVADAALQGIKPFDAYTFDIVNTSSTHAYIVYRLRTRPFTAAELPNVHYNVIAATTRALLVPGNSTSFSGGSGIRVDWTPQKAAAPVDHISVLFRPTSTGNVENNPQVPFSATFDSTGGLRSSATYTVSAPSASSPFPAASGQANGLNLVQLNAHNANDLQLISAAQYSNF